MPSRRSIRSFALAAFAVTAIGCQYNTPNRELHVNDHEQFTPSGRISYEIYPGIETRRKGALPVTPIDSDMTASPGARASLQSVVTGLTP